MTEQPYKIPFYATLLRRLHDQDEGAEGPSLGRQILDDFWKGFQAYMDKLAWRETRLCVSPIAALFIRAHVEPGPGRYTFSRTSPWPN